MKSAKTESFVVAVFPVESSLKIPSSKPSGLRSRSFVRSSDSDRRNRRLRRDVEKLEVIRTLNHRFKKALTTYVQPGGHVDKM